MSRWFWTLMLLILGSTQLHVLCPLELGNFLVLLLAPLYLAWCSGGFRKCLMPAGDHFGFRRSYRVLMSVKFTPTPQTCEATQAGCTDVFMFLSIFLGTVLTHPTSNFRVLWVSLSTLTCTQLDLPLSSCVSISKQGCIICTAFHTLQELRDNLGNRTWARQYGHSSDQGLGRTIYSTDFTASAPR